MTRTLRAALAGLAVLAIAAPAFAADIGEIVRDAKAKCEIGEVADGLLAVVDGKSPSAEVVGAMNEINIKRKALYAQLARERGVGADVVARLTAEKQMQKAEKGECFKDDSGEWKTR